MDCSTNTHTLPDEHVRAVLCASLTTQSSGWTCSYCSMCQSYHTIFRMNMFVLFNVPVLHYSPGCDPIQVPTNDPFFPAGGCMNFARALSRKDCHSKYTHYHSVPCFYHTMSNTKQPNELAVVDWVLRNFRILIEEEQEGRGLSNWQWTVSYMYLSYEYITYTGTLFSDVHT